MIGNWVLTTLIVVVIGYFIGSIPTAYLATRLKTGQDIRKLGGGNVGGLNTYKEVGLVPALIVALIDIAKGAAVAAIAYWPLHLDQPLVAGYTSTLLYEQHENVRQFLGFYSSDFAVGPRVDAVPAFGPPW